MVLCGSSFLCESLLELSDILCYTQSASNIYPPGV